MKYNHKQAMLLKRSELDFPLWTYITRGSGGKTIGGGNRSWTCNFCKIKFNGSYFRVKPHLLKNQWSKNSKLFKS